MAAVGLLYGGGVLFMNAVMLTTERVHIAISRP